MRIQEGGRVGRQLAKADQLAHGSQRPPISPPGRRPDTFDSNPQLNTHTNLQQLSSSIHGYLVITTLRPHHPPCTPIHLRTHSISPSLTHGPPRLSDIIYRRLLVWHFKHSTAVAPVDETDMLLRFQTRARHSKPSFGMIIRLRHVS